MFVLVYLDIHVPHQTCVWMEPGKLVEVVLRTKIRSVIPGDKYLYPLNHLASSKTNF